MRAARRWVNTSLVADVYSSEFEESDLDALPTAYAVAIRLDRAGESHDEIALALGTTSNAVAALLTLAHRKIDEFRRQASEPAGDAARASAPPPDD